ncbi:hypothetical protein GGH95_003577 [Coemansia sp. RSA 1836]|nr:hypothetical protein GGH95_003577 [Coemansia sp. RSA 1836]
MHMSGPGGGSSSSDHVMGFNASSYAMMAGNGVYDPSQHHAHQQSQHQQHYADSGGAAHHGHSHHGAHHQPQQHMQQPHGGYLPQAQSYAHHQHQQHHHHQHAHSQQSQHGDHQLAHNFMAGASGALPTADIYSGFKFISPLYPGRLLPSQGVDAPHPAAQSLYAPQSQSYMHSQQQQHQSQQAQQQHQGQGSHAMPAHSVPSHQPAQVPSSRDPASAAAAAAAAAAAVADLSNSFQLPQAPPQSIYPYYQDSVPTWGEATASSVEMSNGQSHSSPSTPTETLGFGQSQYTLHAVDSQPVYSVVSSNAAPAAAESTTPTALSNGSAQPSAIASLNMVNPITSSSSMAGQPMLSASSCVDDGIAQRNESSAHSAGNSAESDFTSMAAAVAAAAAAASNSNSSSTSSARAEGGGALAASATTNGYLYGYPGTSTSPSLNVVASNLFSMRQIGSSGGPQSSMAESNADAAESANGRTSVDHLAAVAAAAAAASTVSSSAPASKPFVDSQHLSDAHEFMANSEQQQQNADTAHHLRRNMVQSPSFNVNVLSENVQFQNYS